MSSSNNLQLLKEQAPEICLAAVQQNGWVLKFVKDQTPEICMAAVQNTWWALAYVREQTPEICMAAIRKDGMALEYVNMLKNKLLKSIWQMYSKMGTLLSMLKSKHQRFV